MALSIASQLAFAMADAVVALADDQSGGSVSVRLYDGDRPTTLDDEITDQTLLADIGLTSGAPFTFLSEDDSDVIYGAENVVPVLALATGTAKFFRVFSNTDEVLMDGDVSDGSGTGDMKIFNLDIQQGWLVKTLSFVFKISKTN